MELANNEIIYSKFWQIALNYWLEIVKKITLLT